MKTAFLTHKMVQNDHSKRPKWVKFRTQISNAGVIYQPLQLRIETKVHLLRQKTKLKKIINNFTLTLKKSRKQLCRSKNC